MHEIPKAVDEPTGIRGLDEILRGGLTAHHMYLVEGVPGAGKTTLAMQFLLEGRRLGQPVLYISLSESGPELGAMAASHGWSLEGVQLRDLTPVTDAPQADEQYTIFHPSEVELGKTSAQILAEVDRIEPRRLVIDSLSELRLLSGQSLLYRRQILALKQHFAGRRCTVLLLDDMTAADHDRQVQSIAHGVIRLDQLVPEYGCERRRLHVVKLRGKGFSGGYHDYVIRRGGLEVFPRLVAAESRRLQRQTKLSSGLAALDALLGGGIERGTSTLLIGSAGTGKSSIATQFARAAAERGERASLFVFDESVETLLTRAAGLGLDLRPQIEDGRVKVRQIDPAEMSPGEFADEVRRAVEHDHAALVVIDSLNGYLNSMPEERFLVIQLHELLTYLGQQDVATLLIGAHQGMIGTQMHAPVDTSYLADSVVLLRYFEARGEVRQAISVVKKRGGEHERTIREFRMSAKGIHVGEPLRQFRGVLTGVPVPDDAEPPRSA